MPKRELEILDHWENVSLYSKVQEHTKNFPLYVLHDGPPYPNGGIHLGHALNKILKDIIVKYQSMSGHNAPYIPGWDCHGLPIETQLLKELGKKRAEMGTIEFRSLCHKYAMRNVDMQSDQFKRLGVRGDWEHPYLTLNSSYEERVIDLFGKLAEAEYVYRGRKPIHWCVECETALAEAEIEYEDDRSPSIYVAFAIKDLKGKLKGCETKNLSFLIWTTTPWTLPSNVAIAVNPEFDYVIIQIAGKKYLLAESLLEDVSSRLNIEDYKVIAKVRGRDLEGIVCQHPFLERDSQVVLGDMVVSDQGTGCVHIAPGHGEEDYILGLKYDLPMVMPLDDKGRFTSEIAFLEGKRYDEANKIITAQMKKDETLLHLEFIKHSYPHCWRCKSAVIFRATEQWFISVNHNELRSKALQAIKNTKWYPTWGENRIYAMVEGRPDWCISRQRSWGIPIPVFYCKNCGKPHMTGIFNEAIRDLFKKEGSDSWFVTDAKEILPIDAKCECGGHDFKKEKDVFDVWLESGSSHYAVLDSFPGLRSPADLYLEGSDQHRGWFHTSLLLSLAVKGEAPYKEVLTHGFTVDEKGKKMSKSLGNVVDPQEVVRVYGADILRLWVASADFRNDVSASPNILKHVSEAYTKIRNTFRFMLSNLNDFNPNRDAVPYKDLTELDQWILARLHRLVEKCLGAYENYEFHLIFHGVDGFCVNDLSALYLDIVKDILYCENKEGAERRSVQTVFHEILMVLLKLLTPMISFTTEDVWQYLRSEKWENIKTESIQLEAMPTVNQQYVNPELEGRWEAILGVRD
ncbi:MAG: isoleucine--tRNA ligase, partial [bacterium]